MFRLSLSDGMLIISEAGFTKGVFRNDVLPGKYAFGVWAYSRTFDHLVDAEKATSAGVYFLADQSLTSATSLFARAGFASSTTNDVAANLSGGIVFKGVFKGREDDRFGLGVTHAVFGSQYLEAQSALGNSLGPSETAFEATYRIELTPGIAFQPDFQFVINPSSASALSPAKVVAVRLEASL
jgi:carbohydrate-selective porin OprB